MSATVLMRLISSSILLAVAAACTTAAGALAQQARQVGDTRVFATVPEPHQPAGIAVDGRRVLVSTLGMVTQPVTEPRLFVFDLETGKLARSHVVPRAMSASGMALYGVAVDAARRAYVVDMNGAIVRVELGSGEQEVYAAFPAAVGGFSTMPFDLAFEDAGFAYVSDQNLAGIWRVPPGGGAPQLWFQDPRLLGYLFGATGIRIDPSGRHLYFTVAISQHPATAGAGIVYRLPLVERPTAAQLEEVFRYPARSVPFGIAFGASGRLYVTLAGPSQISVLRPAGGERMQEERLFPTSEENSRREVPYDRPLGIAFDGCGSLLVTNSNALSVPSPKRMVVFDVFVGDTAAPLARPVIGDAKAAPALRKPVCPRGRSRARAASRGPHRSARATWGA